MQFATPEAAQAYWEAEYEFWCKLIAAEVTRERLGNGLEVIEIDLYPMVKAKPRQPDFIGKTHLGRALYYAIATTAFDKEGKKVLRLKLFCP